MQKSSSAEPNCVYTNTAPSQHEIVLIRHLLHDHASEVKEIDAELASLRDRFSALENRREAVLAQESALHGSLSAIRRFPAELLCAVFLEAVTPSPADAVFTSEQRSEAPLMLGHICRRWRAVALSYCDLWSSLRVSKSTDINETQERLARTGTTCALRVSFDGSDGRLALSTNSALQLVLTTSQRWIAIRFLNACNYSWAVGLENAMPRLEHIAMFNNDTEYPIPPELFTSCPRLRQAQLLAPHLTDFSLSVEIPWSQLTHLRIALMPEEHFIILQTAVNLIECVLGTCGRSRSDVYPTQDLSLPNLRVFRTEDASVLGLLTAPLLEELTVWSEQGGVDDADAGHILPFLARSSCTLRHLALFTCKAGRDTIISLLRHLTHLETLLIEPLSHDSLMLDGAALIREFVGPVPATSIPSLPALLPALEGLFLGYLQPTETLREALQTLAGRATPTSLKMLRLFRVGQSSMAQQAFGDEIASLGAVGVDAKRIWKSHHSVVEKQWGAF